MVINNFLPPFYYLQLVWINLKVFMNQIITPSPYSKTQDDDQVRSNTIKVSVIVPIYNAGDRIRRCLDTLLEQTLREIEIICVLDCPTDGTDKVVEEYAL